MDLRALSKTTAHALRHEPWVYELELDARGWVAVDDLLAALRQERRFRQATADDLAAMITDATKRRYEIADGRIRALYGHSFSARIDRSPSPPPESLFHGTSPEAAGTILAEGLRPMGRQFVHLSVDTAMATTVGGRKAGRPVILQIRAREAAAQGVPFYFGNEHVWLADQVPAAFIDTSPR